jgi:Flp pilus assembly protein TadD
MARALTLLAAGLALAACSSANNMGGATGPQASADPRTTGSIQPPPGVAGPAEPALLGSDPNDDLSLGKNYYRTSNYGLAEKHFRRAVELHPTDAEAWLGLAASYDRLRRFDLADRAYAQAIRIVGPTVAILNNQGFSYMLRGDFRRARQKLIAAQRKEPENKYVANNIRLLEESVRKGKAVE